MKMTEAARIARNTEIVAKYMYAARVDAAIAAYHNAASIGEGGALTAVAAGQLVRALCVIGGVISSRHGI